MKTIRTDRARTAFLEVFSTTCNVSAACRAANIGRSAAYAWRNDDADFAAAWDEAEQMAIDSLEEEAWTRAKVDKSDRMLEILLKAHRPEKYVERSKIEVSGNLAGEIEEARKRATH
jgi:hypothetical protein